MSNLLFDDDIPKSNGELQDVNITTTILYFSEQELAEFKKLCKEGIKKMWPENYREKGNLADYLLNLIRKDNEETGS